MTNAPAVIAKGTELHLRFEKSPAKGSKTSARNLGRNNVGIH